MNARTSPGASSDPFTGTGGRIAPARRAGLPTGLVVVQLILAYEWLVSGLNKLMDSNFTVQLAGTLRDSINGNPYGPYVSILLIPLLAVTLLVANLRAMRGTAARRLMAPRVSGDLPWAS